MAALGCSEALHRGPQHKERSYDRATSVDSCRSRRLYSPPGFRVRLATDGKPTASATFAALSPQRKPASAIGTAAMGVVVCQSKARMERRAATGSCSHRPESAGGRLRSTDMRNHQAGRISSTFWGGPGSGSVRRADFSGGMWTSPAASSRCGARRAIGHTGFSWGLRNRARPGVWRSGRPRRAAPGPPEPP